MVGDYNDNETQWDLNGFECFCLYLFSRQELYLLPGGISKMAAK